MADTADPENGLPKHSIDAQLDPVFQAAVDSKRLPGVAAIALDASGKVLFSKGYGVTTFGDDKAPNVTVKTPAYVFSCTKLATTIAALQLIEQNELRLEDHVEEHCPAFAKIQVLDRIDDNGQPVLRPPQTKAKVVNLFTHTAGCTYDFFDQNTLLYRIAMGEAPATYVANTTLAYYSTPLKFDPGKAYEYGVNIDWLGLVVEKVSGMRLDQYIQHNILDPLGLQDTHYGGEGPDFFNIHLKDEAGNLTAVPGLRLNVESELVPGGLYLTSTASDYSQLLLTVLNNGTHPISKVSLLNPDTVKKYLFTDQLASLGVSNEGVGNVVVSIPQFSCGGTWLPGITKGWSLGMLTNSEDLPNGRRAGSGAWAGLSNSYYWMDPASGKLGVLIGATLPWFDRDTLHLLDSLERAVYGKPTASVPGEPGSNFSGGEWWKG